MKPEEAGAELQPVAADDCASRLRAERLAAIGELSTRLSGELRQPLSVIRNAVYFLNIHLGTAIDEKVRRHLSIILGGVNGATAIVENLAHLAARTPPQREMADIEVVVAAAIEHVDRPAEIRFETAIAPNATLLADAGQLRVALSNILLNSVQAFADQPVDAAPARPPGVVRVQCRRSPEETVIEVSDNGPGITPEILGRVCEPMFTTSSRRPGLGMTVARSLVGANGGSLEIDSAPDRGTTVRLRFRRHDN